MRISDWSSDVCSSDLRLVLDGRVDGVERQLLVRIERGQIVEIDAVPHRFGIVEIDLDQLGQRKITLAVARRANLALDGVAGAQAIFADLVRRHVKDRKSVVEGKSVSVRVDLGGRRILKKKKKKQI